MFYQVPYSPITQWIILSIFVMTLYYSKELNELFDKYEINDTMKYIIFSIPLVVIIILDMLYHSFSLNNLEVTKFIPNDYINYILRTLGIYGVVQVLSQDFGIKSGLLQNRLTKSPIFHFLCMFGAGFALSGQRSESFISALIYIFLRRLISNNVTIDACFEDV